MKNDISQMIASIHSAVVDSFEVPFDDIFFSFRGYLDNNLANVCSQVLQHYRFVEVDTTLEKLPFKYPVAFNRK